MTTSGYQHCACRDCMEIAIGDDGEPALCHECEEAGCDADSGSECSVEHDLEDTEGEDPHAVSRYVGHLRCPT